MKVLGVSGSPIENSNTDRAVKLALSATGFETEFIKLSNYEIEPCTACLSCVKTNMCIIEDDGNLLCEKAAGADALIVGGWTPYSSLDSRTKAFVERLYPLRHRKGMLAGKPGGAIVTCAVPEETPGMPDACKTALDSIMYFMMEEGMNFAGGVKVLGNVPCISCGHGDECRMSGIKMIYGPDATVQRVGVNILEDQKDVLFSLEKLGKDIASLLGS